MVSIPEAEQNGHPLSPLPAIPGEKLKFDPQMFTQPNLNVDQLMEIIRRESNLKEVDIGLRGVLQHYQYALINLINNDYTKFVELSSRLVAMSTEVSSLVVEHDESWEDYSKLATQLRELEDVYEKKRQILIESEAKELWEVCELNMFQLLDELVNHVEKNSTKDVNWYLYVSHRSNSLMTYLKKLESQSTTKYAEVQNIINPAMDYLRRMLLRDVSFDSSHVERNYHLLVILRDFDITAGAITSAAESICPYSKIEGSLVERWNHFLDAINQRKTFIIDSIQASKLTSSAKGVLQQFYHTALLIFMHNFMLENFEYDFIPTDPAPFKDCYMALYKFFVEFPRREVYANYFSNILGCFDTSIYFQLIVQHQNSAFSEAAVPDKIKVIEEDATLRLSTSEKFLEIVSTLLKQDSLLPGCSELVLQKFYDSMDKYFDFCDDMKDTFAQWNSDTAKPQEESEGAAHQWKIMVVLKYTLRDCLLKAMSILEKNLIANDEELQPLFSSFRDSIGPSCEKFELQFGAFLNTKLYKDFVHILSQVGNVPKKYRWTKIPAPTTHSDYITTAQNTFTDFISNASKCHVDHSEATSIIGSAFIASLDIFVSKANEVLETVEKTANVLRQKAKAIALDANDSDEKKMKKQIVFDAQVLLTLLKNLPNKDEMESKLQEILNRAESGL